MKTFEEAIVIARSDGIECKYESIAADARYSIECQNMCKIFSESLVQGILDDARRSREIIVEYMWCAFVVGLITGIEMEKSE